MKSNLYESAELDKRKRRAWRLCACISTESSTTFIKGGALESAKDTVDKDHLKQLNPALKVTVLCLFDLALLENTQHLYYLYIYMGLVGLGTLASPK
jgi:uncharacterized protein (DUF1778 family)